MKDNYILAFETSCDETSVAILKNGNELLCNIIASQINSHKRFGGVVPEIASRHHVEQITVCIEAALEEAEISADQLTAVAVTEGPGLNGALLVGIMAAKTFAWANHLPLIPVNHMAGHLMAASLVDTIEYPAMALLVSGGHSELVYVEKEGSYKKVGETRDDAAGEAYDKVGRVMGLTYPSGKVIDELAHKGADTYNFPRAMMNTHEVEFSFSGLKSAFINLVHNENQKGNDVIADDLENLAASFQAAVVDVLMAKTKLAMQKYPVKTLIIGGGVSANQGLRERLSAEITDEKLIIPPLRLCGDNAGMIAAAAYIEWKKGLENVQAGLDLNAKPSLVFEDIEEGEV
ncbi:tRNA (adenosine(37)-N6)-threonylcarbamoyltransferase complex transferase subunit TsaD [Lactococcus lactis]|uniref:tRNA (adenosine(37)-N6)-threonylcarbamoyltransferase complex transferase subunit TsaD n=1 Tax=Lactococcus lactis TaxID=1358 RepID=UPI003D17753C